MQWEVVFKGQLGCWPQLWPAITPHRLQPQPRAGVRAATGKTLLLTMPTSIHVVITSSAEVVPCTTFVFNSMFLNNATLLNRKTE
jgi:hypothetical protein